MGRFAGIFRKEGSCIPEEYRTEFEEKIEKLFYTGGMMEIKRITLHEKKIRLLQKAKMTEKGLEFFYNYFEDEMFENAGFDRKNCHIWSNKTGKEPPDFFDTLILKNICDQAECGSHFHKTMLAAYTLEAMYTNGIAVATADGYPVMSWLCVGWIHELFGEQNVCNYFDLWKLFESIHNVSEKWVLSKVS